jgi:hypothetical protein
MAHVCTRAVSSPPPAWGPVRPYPTHSGMNPHMLTHATHALNTLPRPQGRRKHAPGVVWLLVEVPVGETIIMTEFSPASGTNAPRRGPAMPPHGYGLVEPSYGRLLAVQWAAGWCGWCLVALRVRWASASATLLQDGPPETRTGVFTTHPPAVPAKTLEVRHACWVL